MRPEKKKKKTVQSSNRCYCHALPVLQTLTLETHSVPTACTYLGDVNGTNSALIDTARNDTHALECHQGQGRKQKQGNARPEHDRALVSKTNPDRCFGLSQDFQPCTNFAFSKRNIFVLT